AYLAFRNRHFFLDRQLLEELRLDSRSDVGPRGATAESRGAVGDREDWPADDRLPRQQGDDQPGTARAVEAPRRARDRRSAAADGQARRVARPQRTTIVPRVQQLRS